jgi:hypothetical protein
MSFLVFGHRKKSEHAAKESQTDNVAVFFGSAHAGESRRIYFSRRTYPQRMNSSHRRDSYRTRRIMEFQSIDISGEKTVRA